jgi:hypothetical protein
MEIFIPGCGFRWHAIGFMLSSKGLGNYKNTMYNIFILQRGRYFG